jgi:hypothetical protein
MDAAQEPTLPPIPLLHGDANFVQWDTALIQTLRFHGMADYLFKDSTKLVKTARNKAFIMVLITNSVGPITEWIRDAGWEWDLIDQDPKDLYDLIAKVCGPTTIDEASLPKVKDEANILQSFKELRADEYESLTSFKETAECLRDSIGHYQLIDENWGVSFVVAGLKDGREIWYTALKGEMIAGRLNWQRLMKKIGAQAAHELTISQYDDEDDDHSSEEGGSNDERSEDVDKRNGDLKKTDGSETGMKKRKGVEKRAAEQGQKKAKVN